MTKHDTHPVVSHAEIGLEEAGQRLDNFLLTRLKGVPRSHVYRLIRSGQVRVNGGRAAARQRLAAGDSVRIPPVRQRPRQERGGAAALDWLQRCIVFEDDRLIVVDKPSGLAVHGGSGVELGLIEALRSLRPGPGSLELVHRLDRATSGLILIAKRRSTLRSLHGLLREGQVDKRYLTLVKGSWQHGARRVEIPLSTNREAIGSRVRVDDQGKQAVSEFRLIEHFGTDASLLEVRIATGRTHQIRVHASHLGHPIAGDDRYGDQEFNAWIKRFGLRRLFLHAHALGFCWPDSDREFSLSSALPADLKAVLDELSEHSAQSDRGRRPSGRSPPR